MERFRVADGLMAFEAFEDFPWNRARRPNQV